MKIRKAGKEHLKTIAEIFRVEQAKPPRNEKWTKKRSYELMKRYFKNKKLNYRSFMDTGGMPSSHTACVTSLSTAVGIYFGFLSMPFLITLIFSLITMFDATGVRRSVGRQAQLLNRMVDDLSQNQEITYERVRELLGHTPFQVLAGGFLGITIALFICS